MAEDAAMEGAEILDDAKVLLISSLLVLMVDSALVEPPEYRVDSATVLLMVLLAPEMAASALESAEVTLCLVGCCCRCCDS
jgi:hypothetical protein